jgi:hypothetical protein
MFSRTGWLLAIALSGSITLTEQKWVGGMSIYAPERLAVREMMHEAILHNRLPDSVSTWESVGANGLNIRLLTVWTAEALHRLTGTSIQRSYLLIETMALFGGCLLLYAFLEPYTGWPFALASLLYWGSVLPLTYLHHNFHPWDKPSIALWLLALICARQRWWWRLAAVLVIGVATKYDILVFPILVFLAFRRTEPWTLTVPRTALLLAVTVSTFLLLRWFLPNGMEPRPVFDQVRTNLTDLRDMRYYYPPFLALGSPALLAAIGYSSADQFAKACVQLMGIIALILFLQVNFVEFRAEVPLLLLLLPAAWFGLLRIARTDTIRAGESDS